MTVDRIRRRPRRCSVPRSSTISQGETQSRTTERYAHLAQDLVRAAVERVAARVAAASKRGLPAAKIVPIRNR